MTITCLDYYMFRHFREISLEYFCMKVIDSPPELYQRNEILRVT